MSKRRKTIITKYFDNYEEVLSYLNSFEFKEILYSCENTTIEISEISYHGCYIVNMLGVKIND